MAHAYHKVHITVSLVERPVLNHDRTKAQRIIQCDGRPNRHPRRELPELRSVDTNIKNSTLLDYTANYYYCNRKLNLLKSTKNQSATKLMPLPASIVNKHSGRANSMRIVTTSKALAGEGLPLLWRGNSHGYWSKPKKGSIADGAGALRLPPFTAAACTDDSIRFSNELVAATTKRQQSLTSNKAKSDFQYFNVKAVVEKLVKVLIKDRISAQEEGDQNRQRECRSVEAPSDAGSVQENAIKCANNDDFRANQPITGLDLQVQRTSYTGDVNHGFPLRKFMEYTGRRDTYSLIPDENFFIESTLQKAPIRGFVTKENEVNFFKVLDPFRAHVRAYEEQTVLLGTGKELSNVPTQTLVHKGDLDYDKLEIQTDALHEELRKHMEEKNDLALKMAAERCAWLLERVQVDGILNRARMETECNVRMLERKTMEIRNRLQEEMEESKAQWKCEKLRSKEQCLSEKLKKILSEKVELHKEVPLLTTKKNYLVENLQSYDKRMKGPRARVEESLLEVTKLQKLLEKSLKRSIDSNREEKLAADQREFNALSRKCRQKERELMENQKEVVKLQNLGKEQENDFSRLQSAVGKQASKAQVQGKDESFIKLQTELVRLSGSRQGLRIEVETYKAEALALKRKNVAIVERLSTIKRKLSNVAIQLADLDGIDDNHCQSRPVTFFDQKNSGCFVRMKEIADKQGTGINSKMSINTIVANRTDNIANNNNFGTVRLNHSANLSINGSFVKGSKAYDVRDWILSQLELHCEGREEQEKLQEAMQMYAQTKDRLQEEVSTLCRALSLTNHRVQELETQLANKEVELGDMKDELASIQDQRDSVQEQADLMGSKAIRLSIQVDRLCSKIECLDEGVPVKVGQL